MIVDGGDGEHGGGVGHRGRVPKWQEGGEGGVVAVGGVLRRPLAGSSVVLNKRGDEGILSGRLFFGN